MCTAWTGPRQTLAEPVLCFLLVNYAGTFECIVPDKCSLQAKHKSSESPRKGRRKSSQHIELLSNVLQIPLQKGSMSIQIENCQQGQQKKSIFFKQDSQINY